MKESEYTRITEWASKTNECKGGSNWNKPKQRKTPHTPLKILEQNICTSSINMLNYMAYPIVRNTHFHPLKIHIINMFSKFLEISYCCWRTTSLHQGYDNAFQISFINNYATPLYLLANCCKPSRKILTLQNHISFPTAGTHRFCFWSKKWHYHGKYLTPLTSFQETIVEYKETGKSNTL